ncbi:hypothetical protein H5410_044940 [Solanum commersonii]|uniref:Uncharacterized protein n=1 Tax=Solanum commersonii TaxID=4109 RepID=A0A9J5X9K8_SOLCO|nr:hypothetical protein H5410_044940 [Solanum commersonii]
MDQLDQFQHFYKENTQFSSMKSGGFFSPQRVWVNSGNLFGVAIAKYKSTNYMGTKLLRSLRKSLPPEDATYRQGDLHRSTSVLDSIPTY